MPDRKCVYTAYSSPKDTIVALAEALGIDTSEPKYNKNGEQTGDRNLTQPELQKEILLNASPTWALFIDGMDKGAEDWSKALRIWLMKLEEQGVSLVLISTKKSSGDVFKYKTTIEMNEPPIWAIRKVMECHAIDIGLALNNNELSKLQQYAGCNFRVAKSVVEQFKQGIKIKPDQHRQTIVTGPYVVAMLGGFAILRFWGMGTGNRTVYIFGGICLVLFMMARTAGAEIMRPRKGLGQ